MFIVTSAGVEPTFRDSKSLVLPLDDEVILKKPHEQILRYADGDV
jgi:hypothetical protein